MAWRVADAADAFDSLSMPVPSRVYGPAEPSEAAVPRGASALLGASPSEPLAVAVARMVFRRMLAPGLIVTSARYVMLFLDSHFTTFLIKQIHTARNTLLQSISHSPSDISLSI